MSSYYSRVPLLALVLAAGLVAQDDTIKVDVDLVNILCTVRGKNNALIGNLDKGDFHLFEDGKEQEIKYFTRETDLPLTIGLLVDVSGSQERLIETEHRAASQFFRSVLRPKDLAFLISFGKDSELLQDSTNSAKLLEEGLKGLKLNVPVGGLHPGPVPTQQNQAGTVLWDAVYLAANERLKGEVGRKVIVVITDGVDTGSRKTREQAIREAQLADTVVYSIYYTDPGAYGGGGLVFGGGGGEGDLKKLSDETGGRVLKVDRKNTLDDLFKEIQDEMRSQYAIAYTPTNPKKDGTYRKLEFKMASKDQKVQARKGYYAVAN
ncbi:MAG TPA: VWA domain-containing protein [Bryobacteraceae bacterium]|nr:VWA domain-containing protein [Bryobacteraceae bacterium]